MCYVAKTMGTTALLCAVIATAESLGVSRELKRQWNRELPGSDEKTLAKISRVLVKAWRFTGDMEEITETFSEAEFPGGFYLAAASEGFLSGFARPDSVGVVNVADEDLSVTDSVGFGALNDGGDHVFDPFGFDDDLDLHLR